MSDAPRGQSRPMASGRRPSRNSPDQDATSASTRVQRVQPRIPWTRRIGIVIALIALGSTVVLAGGFGNGNPRTPLGSPSRPGVSGAHERATPTLVAAATPKAAPVLVAPATVMLRSRTWTARVNLTAAGFARKDLLLRVFRNDRRVLDVSLRLNGPSMFVRNIPLKEGSNTVSAAYVVNGNAGPISNVLTLTVDTVQPRIDLSQPQDQATINAPTVTVVGHTEAHATVEVRNTTNGATATVDADDNGEFSQPVALSMGGNAVVVTATDAAGNVSNVSFAVTRGAGAADAQLHLSQTVFRLHQLPATFDVTLLVIDVNGDPVDGATVTFSLSPPGLPTSTYTATTASGHATWSGVRLADGLQVGGGFVTARVSLADGSTLQRTAHFTVR